MATFREEELELQRPLAVMLGDLATAPAVCTLTLTPLSRRATEQLARGVAEDLDELYRRTGGNPFFITEVLSDQSRGQDVPRRFGTWSWLGWPAALRRFAGRSRLQRRSGCAWSPAC